MKDRGLVIYEILKTKETLQNLIRERDKMAQLKQFGYSFEEINHGLNLALMAEIYCVQSVNKPLDHASQQLLNRTYSMLEVWMSRFEKTTRYVLNTEPTRGKWMNYSQE